MRFQPVSMAIYGWRIPESREQIEKIFNSIDKLQQGIKIFTPMVVPRYPKGWHNKLYDNGDYHNGDCWIQFSCKGLIAMFEMGYPERALNYLRDIAQVANRDGCFYEYYENDTIGTGKGVSHYNWSNSKYIHSVVKGLFGLQADYPNNILYIHPSLTSSGRIKCRLGMHGIDVQINVDKTIGTKYLTIKTTYSGPVDLRLLIENSIAKCEVNKNGSVSIPSNVETIGKATYVVFRDTLVAGVNTFSLLPQ